MSNVTSWTTSEVDILVQAWGEVEAKYPTLRCQRGTGTLHSKVYTLFSRRCRFVRSSLAVNHMKNQIRNFVLFVHKFDEERRQDGGRFWYELNGEEREELRGTIPKRLRSLTTGLSKEAYVKLLKMDRAQRWLIGDAPAAPNKEEGEVQGRRTDSSFISPTSSGSAATMPGRDGYDFFSLSESNTPKAEQEEEKMEVQLPTPVEQRSDSSTCSLGSNSGDDESSFVAASSPPASENLEEAKKPKPGLEFLSKRKHRDCNILLENMMELQNKKMRRAATKLRADIESEIQRSSEMLCSIISHQFEDPDSSGDVAFVTKVLDMQHQQICDRFDQFMEKRTREEDDNRALLGLRYHEKK